MLFKKKTAPVVVTYDLSQYTPVLRCSICTGEQTAGFRSNTTGDFHEVMLIRNEQDLDEFRRTYGVSQIKKEY